MGNNNLNFDISKFDLRIIPISDEEYKNLRNYVYQNIGINLNEQKKNLLMSRFQKVLKFHKCYNFNEYYSKLIEDNTGALLSELANVISTNHTFFWREHDHFDFFIKTAIPEITKKLKHNLTNDIRIWSAGCSSGEEPYMLVMLMMEYFGINYKKLDAGVLATDISEKALDFAKNGVYPEERIKTLPDIYKKKYFHQISDNRWTINEEVKKEVTFRRFNFMNPVFPFKKQFDVIFCRNVMIYFDDETRDDLVRKFYELTVQNGYFFIGHSETLNRIKGCQFKFVKPALYQKV